MKKINYWVLFMAVVFLLGSVMTSCAKKADKPLNTGQRPIGDTEVFNDNITFSGYNWAVKSNFDNKVGPGPNYFSNSEDDVFVDDQGRLHLKINKRDDQWLCSEVILNESLGYGTYYFQSEVNVAALDRNVVGAFFLYKDDDHEIDVEFSKWAEAGNQNAQFAIQPSDRAGNKERFDISASHTQLTTFVTWKKRSIEFAIYKGALTEPGSEDDLVKKWTYSGQDIPLEEDGLKPEFNLWLFRGNPPSNGQSSEMIISKFGFYENEEDDLNLVDSLQTYLEGSDYYLMLLDPVIEDEIHDRVVGDFRPDAGPQATHFLYFSTSFVETPREGVNPFGLENKTWTSIAVNGERPWASGSIQNNTGTTDFTNITDDYVLHFAVKSNEPEDVRYLFRAGFGVNNGDNPDDIGAKIFLGNEAGDYANFPRDGQWYHYEIPVSKLKELNSKFNLSEPLDLNAHLFDFAVYNFVDGTPLDFGAVFYYKPKN